MADTVCKSGSGPPKKRPYKIPKKRAYKITMEDDSSDDEGSNAEVISVKSSSSESSLGVYSSEAETLDGTSSPDFRQSLSQLSASSALGTQQPQPQPPHPPSSHQSRNKMRNSSMAPLDSLAALAAFQQPSSTATTEAPKLRLTKAFGSTTATKETTKATKRVATNASKPPDDMTLDELSIAYSSTEQAKLPAKKKSPAKKETPVKKSPVKKKKIPAKEKSPAKKAKSPTQTVQSEKKQNETIAKATELDAATANSVPMPIDSNPSKTISNKKKGASTVTNNLKSALTEAVVQSEKKQNETTAKATGSDATAAIENPVPMPIDSNSRKTKGNNRKGASTATTNPKPALTDAVVLSEEKKNETTAKATGSDATAATANPVSMPIDSNPSKATKTNTKAASTVTTNSKPALTKAVVQVQPKSMTTTAPEKETPAAARKVTPSSKATPTAVSDSTKENKPLQVSENEQAPKEAAKIAPSPAPPQKKKKKMSFQGQVLNHMLFSFKPFTLKTLAEELKTTDTALHFVMLSMTDKNLVIKKDFTSPKGRTKTLYWANHDSKAKEVAASMASPEEIEATKIELEDLRRQQASLNSTLAGVSGQISDEELTSQLARDEAELEALREQVEGAKVRIQAGPAPPKQTKSILGRGPVKSAALLARERCPTRTKMRINAMRVEWKKSKEKCMDFIELLADGMEKKPKEVIKLLEIETDEMEGVKMPPKHVIDS
jgi:DNA-binding transcriptional regulator GbsR (MarR family)